MTLIVVPVRYPLSEHSAATLREAIAISEDRNAELTVLHVDLYQNSHTVTRTDLKRAVESEFGELNNTRYVIRQGFLLEETILEEIVGENADLVVIGSKQAGRWQQMVQKLRSDPDIGDYLRGELDCSVVTVTAGGATSE